MDMAQCIRSCLDCADVCAATGRLAIRRTAQNIETLRLMLETCARVCELCAEECARHEHEHCRLCAEMCRECAADCRSEEHTSELQSLMRISYAGFCLKKKTNNTMTQ